MEVQYDATFGIPVPAVHQDDGDGADVPPLLPPWSVPFGLPSLLIVWPAFPVPLVYYTLASPHTMLMVD